MNRLLSFIVSLSALLTFSSPASGQTHGGSSSAEGIHLKKTIEYFDYDTFEGRVRMESFVDGEVTIVSRTKPQDIVLVLDVSASMNEDLKTYVPKASKGYTYDSLPNGQIYYLHTDGMYYRVYRDYITDSNNIRHYYLYFIVGINLFYLSGGQNPTVTTEEPLDYTSKSDVIWTGVLYDRRASMTKLGALKAAAVTFLDKVYADATKEVEPSNHRISIVSFDTGATIRVGLTDVATGYSTLVNEINGLRSGLYTSSDIGMARAAEVLNAENAPERGKVVVMFTDGEPIRAASDFTTVANGAISTSHALKQGGVRVYTVGVFDNPSAQIHRYMNFVSSNYPDASNMGHTPYNGTPSENSYYLTAQDNEELRSVFSSISEDIIGGASAALGEDTVLKDTFASHCSIPKGASDVTIRLAPCTGCTETGTGRTYTWGPEVDAPGTVSRTVDRNGDGEQHVDISGFDYSANWCGLTNSGSGSTPHGYKLVVYVNFKLNVTPALRDICQIQSNTSESGLYDKDGNPVPKGEFVNPVISFGHLTIRTNGLKNGESAIFKLTRGTGASAAQMYDIVVTGTNGGPTASAIIPFLRPNETYTVTEDTNWGWTYSIPGSERSQSATFGADGGEKTFTFDNTKNEYPSNAEKGVKNSLKENR